MSELLHRDVFPAEVFIARTGEHKLAARAFVTSHRLVVYAVGPTGTPERVLDAALTGPAPERDRGTQGVGELEISTADGPVFVTRDSGCGCGSALKALDAPVSW